MEVRSWGKKGTDKVQKKDFLVADHVVLLSLVDADVKIPEIILHGSSLRQPGSAGMIREM